LQQRKNCFVLYAGNQFVQCARRGEQLKEHIKVHQQFAENKGVNYSLKRHGSVVAGENGEIIDFSSPVSTQRREA
jgi:hypothetical protein